MFGGWAGAPPMRHSKAVDERFNDRSALLTGVMGLPADPDGSDPHLRINHLGPFLLTSLLLPSMQPGSRIVNVASRAHYQGSLDVEDGRINGTPSNWCETSRTMIWDGDHCPLCSSGHQIVPALNTCGTSITR